MTFKAMKFRVESPEHSEKIQKVLFDMGYSWKGSNKNIIWNGQDGISTYDTGEMYLLFSAASHSHPEYTLKEIISYELIPVLPPAELIELNGLKYKKSELEEALKLIKPIED